MNVTITLMRRILLGFGKVVVSLDNCRIRLREKQASHLAPLRGIAWLMTPTQEKDRLDLVPSEVWKQYSAMMKKKWRESNKGGVYECRQMLDAAETVRITAQNRVSIPPSLLKDVNHNGKTVVFVSRGEFWLMIGRIKDEPAAERTQL